MIRTTRFTEIHKSLSAKMVEFAGFIMPIQYSAGIIAEHNCVREKVGVFDVSHMGEFEVSGEDALAFVQKITTNDASKLTIGQVQYSAMCYENGCIVDDLLVYRTGEDSYMLVVNGANEEKDWNWCSKNAENMSLELKNASDELNLLAVQGPASRDTLVKLTVEDISEDALKYYSFKPGKLAGYDMIISRTGYTGELGYELYFKGDDAVAKDVWDKLFSAGEEFGIQPVGLGCRDTLRLEKGYCLYGNDIDETTNPIEAGLGWITKLAKGAFNGSEVIAKVKEDKPSRNLVGFVVAADKFIARSGYKIFSGDNEIGKVTSGNLSPTLNKAIGMGYVSKEFKTPGTIIEIEARGKKFSAEVIKLPFVV
ncbi:MAG: glycine cleavage system aminomethyltransferase GcvT [Candidatus Kapabacteria bacterium]|nr:glycine cleavage system aminomethyltransferase GcvT [Ignavibacteriota bacterium]MCW5885137.1 glycine cleavage system aminomethyltransferase GcvT [Candidatus Kapabacteria bacterium]